MAALRAQVLASDGACVQALLDATHICRNKYGDIHPPDELEQLTLGHVREHPGGKRRDERGWCLAQCWQSNMLHWESAHAELARAYLMGVRAGLRA